MASGVDNRGAAKTRAFSASSTGAPQANPGGLDRHHAPRSGMNVAPEDREQTLIEHLGELRACLLKALSCVALVFVCTVYFANDIYQFVALPLIERLPMGSSMIATEIAAPFFVPIKMAFFAAVFISAPYILYQCWIFVVPGLYRRERAVTATLLCSSVLLFYTGCAFAYFVVLPLVCAFFAAVVSDAVQIMPDMQHYLSFVVTIFFAFGIAFEIPVATQVLVRGGWVSREKLRQNRPWVILFAFVAGMVLTPPDMLSQILLAVPVWLLFELGLVLSR